MQTITANLIAGQRREFIVPGALFFMLLETVGPVDVELIAVSGGHSEKAEGVESGFREKALSASDKIGKIVFQSEKTQEVKFGYSVRDADNRKVTSTVSVVSGSSEITEKGGAFVMAAGISAVAGQYGIVEIKNQTTSKNIIITSCKAAHQGSGTAYVSMAEFDVEQIGVDAEAVNKKIGEGVFESVIARKLTSPVVGSRTEFASKRVQPDVWFEIDLAEPLVIPPGGRLSGICGVVAATFQFQCTGYEKDVK